MNTYTVTYACEFTKRQYQATYRAESAQAAVDLCRVHNGVEACGSIITIERVQVCVLDWD